MFNNTTNHKKIHAILILLSLIFIFFKIHISSSIGILGDELNSILVYSTNIKTLFLKNYPGNVSFFHFLGFVSTKIFGYELINYRIITYILFVGCIFIFYLQFRSFAILYLLIILSLLSYLIVYAGLYVGYVFSSFIFILIFYLILKNDDNSKSKIIFILLFIQTYSHLVNLYLSIPILVCLFFTNRKFYKKNVKYFLMFFCIPVGCFYSLSTILTGLAEAKLPDYSLLLALDYLGNNLFDILFSGFNRIFFYEAYANAGSFSIISIIKNTYFFDKIFLFSILLVIILLLLNIKTNKIPKKIAFIMYFHFFMFFLINKDPAPRIFSGFFLNYLFVIFLYFLSFSIPRRNKFLVSMEILLLLTLYFIIYQFHYNQRISKTLHIRDIAYNESIIKDIYSSKCILKNNSYDEMDKKFYYFSYLNICKKQFYLKSFREFYKS